MALPTPGTDDAERRRAVIQRRLASLNPDNTPESISAASGGTAAAAVAPPSFAGGGTIAGAVDQSQRSGERSRFVPTAAQQAEMQAQIDATARANAARTSGGGGFQTSLATQGKAAPDYSTIRTTLSRGNANLTNNPLGLGATPASLGATGSAAVQRATGTAPNSLETQRQLGSAPLSLEGQRALGVAPNTPETQSALGAAPVGQQRLPAPRPTTELPSNIDQAQRAGERSSFVPTPEQQADMQRVIDQTARDNAARTTTTSGAVRGGTVQPPIVPPTTQTTTPKPPIDTTTTADALSRMTTQQNLGGTVLPPGGGQPPVAGGTGPTSLPGGASGGATSSAQLQQTILSDLAGIREQISRGPQAPDVMATFMTMGKSILDMLDAQIADLQAEGSTIDPMTQNTLDRLREELGTQLKATKDALNARGLLDSGILIEAEQMLRKGSLSDASRILAERLSRIQQSVQSLRGQKVSTANEWGMAGVKAQTQAEEAERDRIERLSGRLIDTEFGLYGRAQSAEEAEMDRQFQAEQNQLQRQLTIATKNADLAAQAQDREAEQAWRSHEAALDRELQQSLSAQVTARSGGGGGSARATGASAGGDITDQAVADLQRVFTNSDEAVAAIQAKTAELQQNGVNIQALYDAANAIGRGGGRRAGTYDY